MTDRRAKKTLFDTYWGTHGWKTDRITPAADFEYAKAAGVMFDDVCVEHDDLVTRSGALLGRIHRTRVVDGFVSSLESRVLELRSAIGSYAVLRHLPAHRFEGQDRFCSICHQIDRSRLPEDLNVLNFERLKWGGVRHDQISYAVFDLEQFERLEVTQPSAAAVSILEALLDAIRTAPDSSTAATIHKRFSKLHKGNKEERDTLIAILGFCGILESAEHPGYRKKFVEHCSRQLPSRRFVDMPYPACWWTAADGVNESAVTEWFGHIL